MACVVSPVHSSTSWACIYQMVTKRTGFSKLFLPKLEVFFKFLLAALLQALPAIPFIVFPGYVRTILVFNPVRCPGNSGCFTFSRTLSTCRFFCLWGSPLLWQFSPFRLSGNSCGFGYPTRGGQLYSFLTFPTASSWDLPSTGVDPRQFIWHFLFPNIAQTCFGDRWLHFPHTRSSSLAPSCACVH